MVRSSVVIVACALIGCEGREPQIDDIDAGERNDSGSEDGGPELDDAGVDVDAGEVVVDAGACADGFTAEDDGRCARWIPLNALTDDRELATLVALPDGRALAIGGERRLDDPAIDRSSAAVDVFEDGAWHPSTPMTADRLEPLALLLEDSRVLVVGGQRKRGATAEASGSTAPIASAELFDIVNESWTPAAVPASAHSLGTVTTLETGEHLFIGGFANDADPFALDAPASTVVESYDVALDSWAPRASLPVPRLGHAAHLLDDGRVLVVGGNSVGLLNGPDLRETLFIYSPADDEWLSLMPMNLGRWQPAIVSAGGSRVLVVGGNPGAEPSTEVVDLDDGTRIAGPAMQINRVKLGVVVDGASLFIFGGSGGSSSDHAFISEELRGDAWHTLLSPPGAFVGLSTTSAVRLDATRILVVGTATTYPYPGFEGDDSVAPSHVYEIAESAE